MKKIIDENINIRAENKKLKQQIKDLKNSNSFHRFDSKRKEDDIDAQYKNIVEKNNKIDNLIDLYNGNKKQYLSKLKEIKKIYLTELNNLNSTLNDYKERYSEVYNILNSKDREDKRIYKFKYLIKDICGKNSSLKHDLGRPVWIEPQAKQVRNWEDIKYDPCLDSETVTLEKFSILDLIEKRL